MLTKKLEITDLEKSIVNKEFLNPKSNSCMTICVLTVTNPFKDITLDDTKKFTVTGEKVAYQNDLNKLWDLFEFYIHMTN